MLKAAIITIGDELLIGQTVDTNSAWMAQELEKIGIQTVWRLAVGDVWEKIWEAIDLAFEQGNLVLITGGLGPTADDITKPLLCKYFNGKMVVHEAKRKHVEYLFTEVLKRPMLERNYKQAEVPDTCEVLLNERGTAPGMWFEKEGKILVSMPGVPFEMKGIMTDEVIPKIFERFQIKPRLHKTMLTAGMGESFIAERISNFENNLPPFLKLAYLPNYGTVKLRLSTTVGATDEIIEETERLFEELAVLVKDILVAKEDKPMVQLVFELLKEKNATFSTAESCTGGYIAQLMTRIPGSSAVYEGSVVSYSNQIKKKILGVPEEVLTAFGAVSEQTVAHMLTGVLQAMQTDYALAVSGIMGPDGGSDEKPVGTVVIGVGNGQKQLIKTHHLRYARERNIEQTAVLAYHQLRKFIAETNKG